MGEPLAGVHLGEGRSLERRAVGAALAPRLSAGGLASVGSRCGAVNALIDAALGARRRPGGRGCGPGRGEVPKRKQVLSS